jgi:hypothetical protein
MGEPERITLTTLSCNKNTPISQLPRLQLSQRFREALLTELELLDRRGDMVVRSESEHVVVNGAGSDEAGLEIVSVEEEWESPVIVCVKDGLSE